MMFNSTEEILDDLRQGRMVIIVDDEDRENEGDLLMAAPMVRPEDINFMATHGRGLICLTLTQERCQQLSLPLMVSKTGDLHATNFTVSIEAAEGVTTGISAYDRAHTVRTAVKPNAGPQDIVQPGHIFPLMAQPGGVLTRAGHTEAGCDLARLADLEPSAVIVEILNEDGSMARRPDLERFAQEHGLKIGTIDDLIRYRIENERTMERVVESTCDTVYGPFQFIVYRDVVNGQLHYALTRGDVSGEQAAMVRVHVENRLCDVLPLSSPFCGWPLDDALRRIAEDGCGVAIVLGQSQSPDQVLEQIRAMGEGKSPRKVNDDEKGDLRTLGWGAQILVDLGIRNMRLMSAPKRFHGLAGFGLEVVEYISD